MNIAVQTQVACCFSMLPHTFPFPWNLWNQSLFEDLLRGRLIRIYSFTQKLMRLLILRENMIFFMWVIFTHHLSQHFQPTTSPSTCTPTCNTPRPACSAWGKNQKHHVEQQLPDDTPPPWMVPSGWGRKCWDQWLGSKWLITNPKEYAI